MCFVFPRVLLKKRTPSREREREGNVKPRWYTNVNTLGARVLGRKRPEAHSPNLESARYKCRREGFYRPTWKLVKVRAERSIVAVGRLTPLKVDRLIGRPRLSLRDSNTNTPLHRTRQHRYQPTRFLARWNRFDRRSRNLVSLPRLYVASHDYHPDVSSPTNGSYRTPLHGCFICQFVRYLTFLSSWSV